MPSRGLLVGVLLLATLVGLAFWSTKAKTEEENKAGAVDTSKQLVKIKADEVTRVEIARVGEAGTVLERPAGGEWRFVNPPDLRADSGAVSALVNSFADLNADRIVEEKAGDLSPFGLTTPAAQVKLTSKGGSSSVLLIGDETPAGSSVFAKLGNDARVFTLYTSARDSLVKGAKDLRDKRLIPIETDKLSKIELSTGSGRLVFQKPKDQDWQMVQPVAGRVDNLQVQDVVSKLGEAQMDTSVADEAAKQAAGAFAASGRAGTVLFTGPNGDHSLEVRRSARDNTFYARSSAVEGIHKLSEEAGKIFSKKLDDFRNKKLFDFGFNEPSHVEVKDGATAYAFRKSGDKWTGGAGKEVDVVGIQSLIDKLRDLTATGFAAGAFGQPSLDLSVTAGGKAEKVAIAQAGERFLAKRDTDAALYELDPKLVGEIRRAAADVKPAPPAAAPKK